MTDSIQENNIKLALLYFRQFKEDILNLQTQKSNEHRVLVDQLKNKIQEEKKDIGILCDLKKTCEANIKTNEARIKEIPELIKALEDDIAYCEGEIASTPVPVYSTYYDSETDSYYDEIDYSATAANESYIYNLECRIEEDKEQIEQLKEELERRKGYIVSLEKMMSDIDGVISQKNSLIDELEGEIRNLDEKIQNLKKVIMQSSSEIDRLMSNLNLAISLINSFGTTLAKASYKNIKGRYSPDMTFSASSTVLSEEALFLKQGSTVNEKLIDQMTAINKQFVSLVQSDPTDEAIETINSSNDIQEECSKSIKNNALILSKANEYLLRYEQINF